MPNKLHSLLFLLFLIFFVAAAPLALLYSEGYRYDFDDNEVVKTGGLSFKVKPQVRAKVYLNGERKKKVNGWTYSAYINALHPETYEVNVQEEGFHPWSKKMKVKQGKVTEAKNILMVPKSPQLEKEIENLHSFKFAPNDKKLIYQDTEQSLNIYNFEEDTTKEVGFPTSSSIKWGPESERILVNTSDNYFVLHEGEKTELILPSDAKGISFNPDDPTKIFYTRNEKEGLLKLDYSEEDSKPTPTIMHYLDYELTPEGIFWLSSSGQIHQSDFSGSIQSTLSKEALPIEKKNYKILREGGKTLIKAGELLYSLTEEGEFKKLASDVNRVKFSPHVQKAALISDYEINVVYLNKQYGQPRKEKYDKDFINRFSSQIEKVSWFGSHHLIFNLKNSNKIKISGIDNRSQINMVNYLSSDFQNWYWNEAQKAFYFLKNQTLYRNSFLNS
ncbi:MAG: hypothetical protein V5A57_01415 [Candidatus Paceibacterota bacterium]